MAHTWGQMTPHHFGEIPSRGDEVCRFVVVDDDDNESKDSVSTMTVTTSAALTWLTVVRRCIRGASKHGLKLKFFIGQRRVEEVDPQDLDAWEVYF